MMRFLKAVVGGWLLWGSLAVGSLEIYEDGVTYRYIPVDDYVGFVRESTALCGGREVPLVTRQKCPEAKRLCKEAKELEAVRAELETLHSSLSMLDLWVRNAKPSGPDAGQWITAAEKMGKQQAQWQMRERHTEADLKSRERHFRRQVSADVPRFLSRRCKEELELTLPPGVIDVNFLNVAELDTKTIRVTRFVSLRNHSGVDISSKDVRIYAHGFHRTLRPIRFRPWVIRPVPRGEPSKQRSGEDVSDRKRGLGMEQAPRSSPSVTPRPLGDRDYSLGKIDLPSTGEELRIKLDTYSVPRKCEELSYPWKSDAVYVACRFTPKRAVEGDRWIVKRGRRLLSENAYGEYVGGEYLLFVNRDDSVKVRRSRLVERERSRGVSGGKIRKKDGYLIDLENRSDQEKEIVVVARIPRATSEKIAVKLLKADGADRESLDEQGRLRLKVHLPPRGKKRIRVLFEVTYPRDLQVVY